MRLAAVAASAFTQLVARQQQQPQQLVLKLKAAEQTLHKVLVPCVLQLTTGAVTVDGPAGAVQVCSQPEHCHSSGDCVGAR